MTWVKRTVVYSWLRLKAIEVSIFTSSGLSEQRFFETMCPLKLNIRSLVQLVAQTVYIFFTNGVRSA